MRKRGTPTEEMYRTVMGACAKAGQTEQTLQLLKEITSIYGAQVGYDSAMRLLEQMKHMMAEDLRVKFQTDLLECLNSSSGSSLSLGISEDAGDGSALASELLGGQSNTDREGRGAAGHRGR